MWEKGPLAFSDHVPSHGSGLSWYTQHAFLPQDHASCIWTPEVPAKMALIHFQSKSRPLPWALPTKSRPQQWRKYPWTQGVVKKGLFVGTWMALVHTGWGINTHAQESPHCAGQLQWEEKREPNMDWGAGSPMLSYSSVELLEVQETWSLKSLWTCISQGR